MTKRSVQLLAAATSIVVVLSLAGCARERPALRQTATSPVATAAAPGPGAVAATPQAGGMQGIAITPAPATGGTGITAPAATAGMPAAPIATPVVQTQTTTTGNDGQHFVYLVVPGDTLNSIAAEHNTTAEELMSLNDLSDPNNIGVGQEIKIPGQGSGAASGVTGGEGNYTVQPGETLYSIANRLGIPLAELQDMNDIDDPNNLVAGQLINIPGGGSTGGGSTGGGSTAAPGGSTGEGSRTHVVEGGDTLNNIAARYGVSVADLQNANNIADPDQIYWGQVLTIPGGGAVEPVAAGDQGTHIVQPGETLARIAVQYGVTAAAIQAANGIADADQIYVGQVLTIP